MIWRSYRGRALNPIPNWTLGIQRMRRILNDGDRPHRLQLWTHGVGWMSVLRSRYRRTFLRLRRHMFGNRGVRLRWGERRVGRCRRVRGGHYGVRFMHRILRGHVVFSRDTLVTGRVIWEGFVVLERRFPDGGMFVLVESVQSE
jgi:hypothetical protein